MSAITPNHTNINLALYLPSSTTSTATLQEDTKADPNLSHYSPFIQSCIHKGFLNPDTLEVTELAKKLPIQSVKQEHLLDFLEFLCQEVPVKISQRTKDHFKKLWTGESFRQRAFKEAGTRFVESIKLNAQQRADYVELQRLNNSDYCEKLKEKAGIAELELIDKMLNSNLLKSSDEKLISTVYLYELLFEFNRKFPNPNQKSVFIINDFQCSEVINRSAKLWELEEPSSTSHMSSLFSSKTKKRTIRCKLATDDHVETIDRMGNFVNLIATKFAAHDLQSTHLYKFILEYEFQLNPQHKGLYHYVSIQLGPEVELVMEDVRSHREICSLDAFYLSCDALCHFLHFNSVSNHGRKINKEDLPSLASKIDFPVVFEGQAKSIHQTFFDWMGKVCHLHRCLEPQEIVKLMELIPYGFTIPASNTIHFQSQRFREEQMIEAMLKTHEKDKNGEQTLTLLMNTLFFLHSKMKFKNDSIQNIWKSILEKCPEVRNCKKSSFMEAFYSSMQKEISLDKIIQDIQLLAFIAHHTEGSDVQETQWMGSHWKIEDKIVIPRLPKLTLSPTLEADFFNNIFNLLKKSNLSFKPSLLWNSDYFPIAQIEKTALAYLESQYSQTIEMGFLLLMHCQASHPNPAILENLYKYFTKLFLDPVEQVKIKTFLETLIKLNPKDETFKNFSLGLIESNLTFVRLKIEWIKALTSSTIQDHQKLGIQLLNDFLKNSGNGTEIQAESLPILKNLQSRNHPELISLFLNLIKKNVLPRKQLIEFFHSCLKNFSNKKLGDQLLLVDCLKVILDQNKNDKNFVFSNDEEILNLISWLSDKSLHIEVDLLENASTVLSKNENLQSLWLKILNQKISKNDTQAVLEVWSKGKSKNIWQIKTQEQLIPKELYEFYKNKLLQEPPFKNLCQEIIKELSQIKSANTYENDLHLFLAQAAKIDGETALKLSKIIESYLKTTDTFAVTIFEASKDQVMTDKELIELAKTIKSVSKPKKETLYRLIKNLIEKNLIENTIETLFWAINNKHLSVNSPTREVWLSALEISLKDDRKEAPSQQCISLLETGIKLTLGDIPKDSPIQNSFLKILFTAFSENHSDRVKQLLLNILKWTPTTSKSGAQKKTAHLEEKPFSIAMKTFIHHDPQKAITVLKNIQVLNSLSLADEKAYVIHLLLVLTDELSLEDYLLAQQIVLSLLKRQGHGVNFEEVYPLIKRLILQKLHKSVFDLLMICLKSKMSIEPEILHPLFLSCFDSEIQKKSNDTTFALKIWREGQGLKIWNQETLKNGSECLTAFLNILVAGKLSSESEQAFFEIVDMISKSLSNSKDPFVVQLRHILDNSINKNPVFAIKLLKSIFSIINAQTSQLFLILLLKKLMADKAYKDIKDLIQWVLNLDVLSALKKAFEEPSIFSEVHELKVETHLIGLGNQADPKKVIWDNIENALETLVDSLTYEEIKSLNLDNSEALIHVNSQKVRYCLFVQILEKLAAKVSVENNQAFTKLILSALNNLNNALKQQKKEGLIFPKAYLLKHAKTLRYLGFINNAEKETSFELLLPLIVNHGASPQTDPKLLSAQKQSVYDFLADFCPLLLRNLKLSHRCLCIFLSGAAIAAEADEWRITTIRQFKGVFDLFKGQPLIQSPHVNLYVKFIRNFLTRLIDDPQPETYLTEIQYWIDLILNESVQPNRLDSQDILKWVGFYHSRKNPSMTNYYLLEFLPQEMRSPELYEKSFSLIINAPFEIHKDEPLICIVEMLCEHKERIKTVPLWHDFVLKTIQKITESELRQDHLSLYKLGSDFEFLYQSDFFHNYQDYVLFIKTLVSLPQLTKKLLPNLAKILDQFQKNKFDGTRQERNYIIYELLTCVIHEDISLDEKIATLKTTYFNLTNRSPNPPTDFFEFIKNQAMNENCSSEFFDFAQVFAAATAIAHATDDNPDKPSDVACRSFIEACEFIESSLNRMVQLNENLLLKEYSSAILIILQSAPYFNLELDRNTLQLKSIKDWSEKICVQYWSIFSKQPEALIRVIKSFMSLSSNLYADGIKLFYKLIGENIPNTDFSNCKTIEMHYQILTKAARKKDSLIEQHSELNELFVRIMLHGLVLMYKENRNFNDFLERTQSLLQIVAHTKLDKKEPQTVDTMKIWSPERLKTSSVTVTKHVIDINASPIDQVIAYLNKIMQATTQTHPVIIERPNLMRFFGSPSKASNQTIGQFQELEGVYHQRLLFTVTTMVQKLLEMTYKHAEDYHKVSYFCDLALEFLINRYPKGSYSHLFKYYAFHPQGFESAPNLQKHIDNLNGVYHHLKKYEITNGYLPQIFQYSLFVKSQDSNQLNLAFERNIEAFNEFRDLLLNMEIGNWSPCLIVANAITQLKNPDHDSTNLTLQGLLDKVEKHLYVNNKNPILCYDQKPILFMIIHQFTAKNANLFPIEFYDKLMNMLLSETFDCPVEFKQDLFDMTNKLAVFMEEHKLMHEEEESPSNATTPK